MLTEVWYKIKGHPWFNEEFAYRALAYTLHSESAWAYLTFLTTEGHTVGVQVWRCTALRPTCENRRHVDHSGFWRPLTETEREQPWAKKPARPNPDLDLDLQ